MTHEQPNLEQIAAGLNEAVDQALGATQPELTSREVGRVVEVGPSYALVEGLPGVKAEEVVRFPGDKLGMAFNLDADQIGVVLMDPTEEIHAGTEVRRTGRVMDVPVGPDVLGRIVDAAGRPLDGRGPVASVERRPIERDAAGILDRDPVEVPLQTGIKVIDALIPVGRGQRELILGDRQTGKTAIAIDTILNQKDFGVVCIYCAIGQRSSAVAKVVATLRDNDAMDYTAVVVSTGEDTAGLRFAAPYAAVSMAEYLMEQGKDVLIVYDDLTRHARAYRELSLLLRRPPGREAFPGDIFYIHSRLLERATHLNQSLGGGSITALPIVETHAQNISAYIPTNLISITDGQVYLSPTLFQQGQIPAVDVGKSVSRVGGKAQLPAFRAAAGDLRLSYSQFEELERFSRYGARLEEAQRKNLEHGRRVREVLKQGEHAPLTASEQVAVLLAVSEGLFDDIPVAKVAEAQQAVRQCLHESLSEVAGRIESGEKLSDDDQRALLETLKPGVAPLAESNDGNA